MHKKLALATLLFIAFIIAIHLPVAQANPYRDCSSTQTYKLWLWRSITLSFGPGDLSCRVVGPETAGVPNQIEGFGVTLSFAINVKDDGSANVIPHTSGSFSQGASFSATSTGLSCRDTSPQDKQFKPSFSISGTFDSDCLIQNGQLYWCIKVGDQQIPGGTNGAAYLAGGGTEYDTRNVTSVTVDFPSLDTFSVSVDLDHDRAPWPYLSGEVTVNPYSRSDYWNNKTSLICSVLGVCAQSSRGDSMSVSISYSGTFSGSQDTCFALKNDDSISETLTAPTPVTSGVLTYDFVKWVVGSSEYTSTSISVSVSKSSRQTVTAVYKLRNDTQPPPPPPSPSSASLTVSAQTSTGSSLSVTISYSGTLSGNQTTSFTLTNNGDMSETLTAPSSVTVGGTTYNFVKWSTSDGDSTSTSVTISVSKGSSKSATAIYQAQNGGGGGNPPQPPSPSPSNATFTLQLYRVNSNGASLGPASGVQVSINGVTYTTGSDGKVTLTVKSNSTVSVQVSQTYFNNNWGRYTFWEWSDGNTQNPRSFTVSSDTTVTGYVYDERLIKITWSQDAAGHVNVNGQPVSNGWTSWYRYGTQLTLQAVPTSGTSTFGVFKKWQRGINGGSLADYSTASTITVTVENGYQFKALFDLIITIQLGTMYLPGEGISMPWLENMSNWAWNGVWLFNATELYRVNEHVVMILTDGSSVKVIDLPNGTSLKVYLPSGWKNNPFVKMRGQVKITQIPSDKNTLTNTFPAVNVSGQTWYLVALAAWNPYKQFSGGYNTSCWLANGTTLAVYNLTYTYAFGDETRVIFKEPAIVSTLKTTVTPIYSYNNMKQGLTLNITVKWKYLPPARKGIQPQPPSSIVGVAVIGNTIYNGTLISSDSTSKTFLVTITNDTWTLYSKGVNSVTALAYWLSSMGTPEGPVAMQDPAQLSVVYAMPHIDSISEGSSLTATVSILDAKSGQTYSGNIYVELRDPNTMNLVASYGPFYVSGSGTITINFALAIATVSTR